MTRTEVHPWKDRLHPVSFSQSVVGKQCFFHPSIVGNVLPLRVDAVDVESLPLHLHGVVAVLLNYASGLFQVATFSLRLPPVDKISVPVLLASLVVKTVGDLVPHHKPDGSIVM